MDFAFKQPYTPADKYSKAVVYLCMEYGIDQALKIYAGGLGFLSGSFLKSAYQLKQNIIAVGILWKYGYYDQVRKQDQSMDVLFEEKNYAFLTDTGIEFMMPIDKKDIWIKVWYLEPAVFSTAPLFLLSTDTEKNDYPARTITHKLYDADPIISIAASILLGNGSIKLMEILGITDEIYHLNESHALSIVYALYKKYKNIDTVRKKLVYTNHTPEEAGNRKTELTLLEKMGFFNEIPIAEVNSISTIKDNLLDHTLTAMHFSGKINCVSKLHLQTISSVVNKINKSYPLNSITNAQSFSYWADKKMYAAIHDNNPKDFIELKQERKKRLFDIVADQCGKIFKTEICTLVFAKRFTGYKRPDLFFQENKHFIELLNNTKYPIQIIWAGKPYPMDYTAIGVFNKIVNFCKSYNNAAILIGYELSQSKLLKGGADIWLNTPRMKHEASGTSGISAAMNGALNVALPDGWFPEFAKDKINAYIIPPCDPILPEHQQDNMDAISLLQLLETEVLPLYYDFPNRWYELIQNSMNDVSPAFDSDRMAKEYYELLYV